jgi:pimeloyl-ACP methyl ester carboxylesterase
MAKQTDAARVGRFRNEKARATWLAAYDDTLTSWPVHGEPVDVSTRYGPTRAYRYGPATGTPVVLLPGMGGGVLGWVYSVGPLSAEHPVYAVDPVGVAGRSVQTAPLHDADDLVRWLLDLLDLLDGLDAGPAHLVGYSYGGWYAVHTARHAPDRVATLTLLDPGGFAKVGWRHYRWALATGLAALGPRAWHGRIGRRLHTPSLARIDDIRVGLRAMAVYRSKLPPIRDVFTDDELAAVTVPTLLMLGEHSTLHRSAEVAQRVAALLPQVRIDLVPEVGHSLPFDAPDAVNSATLTFLSTRASSRPEAA